MLYCVTLAYCELHLQVQMWRLNLASRAALTVSLTSKSMFLQRGVGGWWGGGCSLWLLGALRYETSAGVIYARGAHQRHWRMLRLCGGKQKEGRGWIKADLSACHNVGMGSYCNRDLIIACLHRITVQIWPVVANINACILVEESSLNMSWLTVIAVFVQ